MGWVQDIRSPITCVTCGRRANAQFYFPSPRPEADGPYEIEVGGPLGFDVSDYDFAFIELRKRADPEAGRVIVDWGCRHCTQMRWALASLGDRRGVPSLLAVESCPMTSASVAAADWIDPMVLLVVTRNLDCRYPGPYEQLDAAQLERLGEILDQQLYLPPEERC